jgi:uroporphyrin-III C-methyltransferase/precorrin-2 dehydrogenase/sirohydrochlorin ferrochelatase
MGYHAAFLDLSGRDCRVVGGGEEAWRKAAELLRSGARVTVIADRLCPQLEAVAAGGRVTVLGRRYRPGDLAGAWLAVDASGEEVVNRACRREADRQRVLLNVLDRPALCDFIAPAVVRRGPLQIAISTSGQSPFLAAALRQRLEGLLGPEWAGFTALVGRVRRRLRRRGLGPPEQLRVYRRLTASPVLGLLRTGQSRKAAALAGRLVAEPVPSGRVWLVGAGPGDPGLLTLRALELLANAEVVLHDALVPPEILRLCPQATLIDVGKRPGSGPDQAEVTARMVELARSGHEVVRLKGGDPMLFARGGEELEGLRRAGVEVGVVPGVSAVFAAAAAAGVPLTRRGTASSVAIVSGQLRAGSPPDRLEELAAVADTLVVMMPIGRLEELATRLRAVRGPDCQAVLVACASRPGQRVLRTTLARLAHQARVRGLGPPATLIVGDVVRG